MSDINDALEFIKVSSNYKEPTTKRPNISALFPPSEESEVEVKPSDVTQYSLFGNGYVPTADTIKTLPSGSYNINIDQNKGIIFAEPMPKPVGLLLELPEMRSEQVINVVEQFWNSEKDYKEGNEYIIGGAAYKAGIFVFGPPGSGKTCTLKLVSNKLVERGGTVFFASVSPYVVMSFLSDFHKIEKSRKCIVIMEDLDSLISVYGESAYLEMLDSAKTIDNVLFLATTNYPDRLDPRIYNRPGRFSHVIKIGMPTPKARNAYLRAILKKYDDVDYMVENTAGFSIDHLTALVNAVYREKKEMKAEIARLRALFQVPQSEEKSIGIGLGE